MTVTNRFTALGAALLLGFPAIAQTAATGAADSTATAQTAQDGTAQQAQDSTAQQADGQTTVEQAQTDLAAADPDVVMATVNGTDITLGHLIAMRDRLPEQYQQLPDEVLYKGLLDQLIQQTALAQSLSGDNLRLDLAIENETRALKADAALSKLLGEKLDEATLRAAYDEQIGNAEALTEWNASHILVETEEEAKELVTELEGGADFAELAKEKSTGPSGPNGGELGWFGAGQMVPEFETAVQDMEKGAISAPVQTQFGWHVVKLNDTREAEKPSFEQVRPQLEQALAQQETQAIMEEVTAKAEVTRNEVNLDPSVITKTELLDQ